MLRDAALRAAPQHEAEGRLSKWLDEPSPLARANVRQGAISANRGRRLLPGEGRRRSAGAFNQRTVALVHTHLALGFDVEHAALEFLGLRLQPARGAAIVVALCD